jgi:cation diffusion facilitator family transporter
MDVQRRKVRVALLSVISNTILVILKLVAGLMTGSVSIISEAIHSASDLLAALIAFFSVRTSNQPADTIHPFGHGKIESISGGVEALLIFLAAAWIIWKAIEKLIHPTAIETLGWGIGVMLISTIVNIVVSQMLFTVAKETDSIALEADAWHLRTDVYTSAGVMISLTLIWLGEKAFPGRHFHWLDPVAAIAIALLIIKAACDLTVKSSRDLMDSRLPAEEEAWIGDLIREDRHHIHGFHNLRTRKAGGVRFVEFHLKVDPTMTVIDSHHITDQITARIQARFPGASVTIHIEPCDGKCEEKCLQGCLLPVKGDTGAKSR